jgi:hypothetical protein
MAEAASSGKDSNDVSEKHSLQPSKCDQSHCKLAVYVRLLNTIRRGARDDVGLQIAVCFNLCVELSQAV